MPRRCNDNVSEDDVPPKKKCCNNSMMSSFVLKHGEYLKDISGKEWKLGKAVGVGGFGEIYLASDNLIREVKTDSNYVAKVESHKNGPLFVEMNCYLRIAKREMIENWKTEKRMVSLGMPHYVASGSHFYKGERYRFLILPKFDKDLEKILHDKKMLNLKSVLTISLQIIDVLEYIHSKGYIHSDIKASNILLSKIKERKKSSASKTSTLKQPVLNPMRTCRMQKVTRIIRNLRPTASVNYHDDVPNWETIVEPNIGRRDKSSETSKCNRDQAYLLDYGLACKYLTSEGKHKPYCVDERKAHAGTVLFCSRDAHKGVASRRSDLESLGYNIIYWLTGNLPWSSDVDDPEIVEHKKLKVFTDIEYFLRSCFSEYPKFLEDYFKYIQNLQFQDKPDYNYCKKLFRQSMKMNGYKNDSCFDFYTSHNPILKPTKSKKRISENIKVRKIIYKVSRPPLQSNIPIKPLLRKEVKNNKIKRTNWFEDIADPENIMKQAREKKNSENSDSSITANVANLNINRLNPTYAMIEVYNKCMERIDSSPSHRDDSSFENIDGYTHAMMSVVQKIKKQKELEYEAIKAVNLSENKNLKNIKKNMSKRKKKFKSPARSPPKTRITKSVMVVKKEVFQTRKIKSGASRRTYSLRG